MRLGLLIVAMLAATWIAGWWGIALVAAAWGWRGRALEAAIAAFVAWVALLAFAGGSATLLPFARRLGGIFSLPGWAMLIITPLFAGLLAWGVAALVGIRRPVDRRP
ncbi:MAG TPA: hypothetical protein VJU15_14980 [Gemmatimonadales bacterium]|nr:hypothetical protein [Gemmatimonadales bacterium]